MKINNRILSLDPKRQQHFLKCCSGESRGGESPCWDTIGAGMDPTPMEGGAKGEKWEFAEEGILRKLWKKWAKVEVGGEGAGGQPAKNQLNESELVNRHSFRGDTRCSSDGNTDPSCWKHTQLFLSPQKPEQISAGRVKWEPCSRVPWTAAVLAQPSDQSAGRL